MRNNLPILSLLLAALVLAGCHGEHGEPSSEVALPTLERPVADVERRNDRLYVPEAAVTASPAGCGWVSGWSPLYSGW